MKEKLVYIQFDGDNIQELSEFTEELIICMDGKTYLRVISGYIILWPNDYVVKNANGELFFPYSPNEFKKLKQNI